jgi:hypothetical protein
MGTLLLPLMLFHQIQLFVRGAGQRLANRADSARLKRHTGIRGPVNPELLQIEDAVLLGKKRRSRPWVFSA